MLKKIIAATIVICAIAVLLFVLLGQPNYLSPEDLGYISETQPFVDVGSEDDNFTAIKYLARQGILEGDEDQKFRPKEEVTRAEWAQLLVRLSGIEPDTSIYRDCFKDVHSETFAAAVCYANERGWLEASAADLSFTSHRGFIIGKALAADTNSADSFGPEALIQEDNAVGSLARTMNWNITGDNSDSESMQRAKEANIYEPQKTNGSVTRGDAAELIFRSVATIPFGQKSYNNTRDESMKLFSINTLVDTEPVGSKDSNQKEVEQTRNVRYMQRLAWEKAETGKDTPSFNILEPLQNVFSEKGIHLTMDDIKIYKSSPLTLKEKNTRSYSPIVTTRDNLEINIFLDENYGLITKEAWGRTPIKYIMSVDLSSMYDIEIAATKGRAVGKTLIDIVDLETGVMKSASESDGWTLLHDPGNIKDMIKQAVRKAEVRLGQPITAINEPSTTGASFFEKLKTPNKNRRIKNDKTKPLSSCDEYAPGAAIPHDKIDCITDKPGCKGWIDNPMIGLYCFDNIEEMEALIGDTTSKDTIKLDAMKIITSLTPTYTYSDAVKVEGPPSNFPGNFGQDPYDGYTETVDTSRYDTYMEWVKCRDEHSNNDSSLCDGIIGQPVIESENNYEPSGIINTVPR